MPVPSPSASRVDWFGVFASGLCTVHCIAMSVVLSFSPVVAHLLPAEEHTHRVLAVAVACLGALALWRGYRLHQRLLIPVLMALGVLCIAAAAWWGDRLPAHAWEVGITCAGSILMITAHRLNHTFCRTCTQQNRCCTAER